MIIAVDVVPLYGLCAYDSGENLTAQPCGALTRQWGSMVLGAISGRQRQRAGPDGRPRRYHRLPLRPHREWLGLAALEPRTDSVAGEGE